MQLLSYNILQMRKLRDKGDSDKLTVPELVTSENKPNLRILLWTFSVFFPFLFIPPYGDGVFFD